MNRTTYKPMIGIIEYILLFLGFFEFTGRGTYFLLFFCAYYVFSHTKSFSIDFDLGSFIFYLFIVFYAIFTVMYSDITNLLVPICAFLLFCISKSFALKNENKKEIGKVVFVMVFAITMHGLINFAINISAVSNSTERMAIDVWTRKKQLVTGNLALFIPIISASFVTIFIGNRNLFVRIFGIVGVVCGVLFSLVFATRYIFYLFFVVIVVELIVYLITEKDVSQKNRVITRFVILLIVVAIVLALNLFNARQALFSSNLATRVEEFDENSAFTSVDRSRQMMNVLSHFTLYLWGGKPTGMAFVHNTWLSVLNLGGVFMFIPFTIFTIRFIINVFACAKRLDTYYYLFLLGYMICMMVYCWIEPLLEGSRVLFYSLCFIAGFVEGTVLKPANAKKTTVKTAVIEGDVV